MTRQGEVEQEPSAEELRAARATAYVLGELSVEERAALEAEMAKDEDLAREIEEIRETAGLLARELRRDAPPLEDAQRGALEKKLAEPAVAQVKKLPERPRRRWWMASLGVAAALAAAIPLVSTVRRDATSAASVNADDLDDERAAEETGFRYAPAATAAAPAAARPVPADQMASKSKMDAKLAEDPSASPGNDHATFAENPFIATSKDTKSTFSIDVDTASYSLVRNYLAGGTRPPKDAVRIEELVNYFTYDYPEPAGAEPFSVKLDMAAAPWAPSHRLVRVGLLGKKVTLEDQEGVNLVFLVDSSGSMAAPNKLPLLRESLKLLLPKLGARDRVSIVAYAGAAGLVLPPTPGNQADKIVAALDNLSAGGSTNGGQGIELAYKVAEEQLIKGGVNRVVLCTDGDFNVGVTSRDSLVEMVKQKAKSGVFLSVLGFGMGNLKDGTLEQIADKGNGNYAYVDTIDEGRKVLAEGLGTLVAIAKDVKIQVEFDPKHVESFRLLGYENRVMAHKDFHDDTKDAGELGSGHTVTALYEVVPKSGAKLDQVLKVQLRYKDIESTASKLIEAEIGGAASQDGPSADFRFAAGVAAFGMLLRDSPHKGSADWKMVRSLLEAGVETDKTGRRRELLELVGKAETLSAP